MLRGRVEVDTHIVDATLDGLVEGVLEFRLIHVVLVLSYTNALGVDLDEFCEGIHQATTYRDGTTNSDILIRELVAGYLRGGIDGSAIFGYHKDLGASLARRTSLTSRTSMTR